MGGAPQGGGARLPILLGALACALCLASPASATPTVTLKAGLHPERLGAGTTIKFAFSIAFAPGEAPSPIRVSELRYPAHMGIVTSSLGLSTCHAARLEAQGPPGCPTTSVMGYGSGLFQVPFGPSIVQEKVRLTTFMGPLTPDGNLGLLFYAEGNEPVNAELVFTGEVLHTTPPFGGDVTTAVPLVPTLPGARDAVLTTLKTTLGPEHITYLEYKKGRRIPYHPRGILLPPHCPHGGFQFAAAFTFDNDAHTSAHAVVPCPGTASQRPNAHLEHIRAPAPRSSRHLALDRPHEPRPSRSTCGSSPRRLLR
jgi:hypothetical protein